jgi:hypothetical protein
MADPTRNPDVERRINEHLEAIDRALAAKGVLLTERRSVTGDVEAQIRDMLAEKAGGAPTAADVEGVLLKLDAPESYAEDAEGALPAVAAEPPRYPRTAIAGVGCAAVLFLPGLLILFYLLAMAGGPPWCAVILLAMLLLFPTTILGWVAVGQIRRSKGRLCGLGLALADGLLFPLLALDVLVFLFTRMAVAVAISCKSLGFFGALGRPSYSVVDQNTLLIFVLAAVTALVVDWLIARWAWRRLRVPVRQ